jgi:hypothetical protein
VSSKPYTKMLKGLKHGFKGRFSMKNQSPKNLVRLSL